MQGETLMLVRRGRLEPPKAGPDGAFAVRKPKINSSVLLSAGILVVGAIVVLFVLPPLIQGDAPSAVVRQLCAAEQRQDYAAAYALFAPSYHNLIDEASFVQGLRQRDAREGAVRACTVTGRDYARVIGFKNAAFDVVVTLGDGTHTGTVQVDDEQGWAVQITDPQLHLEA
jgi:hypothetical protein